MQRKDRATSTGIGKNKRGPWTRSEINGTIASVVALIGCLIAVVTFVGNRSHHASPSPDAKKGNQDVISSAPGITPAPDGKSPVAKPQSVVRTPPLQQAETRDQLKALIATIDRITTRCQQVSDDNKRISGLSGELPVQTQKILEKLRLDEQAAQHAIDSGDVKSATKRIADAGSILQTASQLSLCNP